MNSVQNALKLRAEAIAAAIVRDRATITEHELVTLVHAALEDATLEVHDFLRQENEAVRILSRELGEARAALHASRDQVVHLDRELDRARSGLTHARLEIDHVRDVVIGALAAQDARVQHKIDPKAREFYALTCDGTGRILANVIDSRSGVVTRQFVQCSGCDACRAAVEASRG